MPFHCDQCGREWWWEFGLGGPMGKQANPPPCQCGGRSTEDALPRCPKCHSKELERDPGGYEFMYD